MINRFNDIEKIVDKLLEESVDNFSLYEEEPIFAQMLVQLCDESEKKPENVFEVLNVIIENLNNGSNLKYRSKNLQNNLILLNNISGVLLVNVSKNKVLSDFLNMPVRDFCIYCAYLTESNPRLSQIQNHILSNLKDMPFSGDDSTVWGYFKKLRNNLNYAMEDYMEVDSNKEEWANFAKIQGHFLRKAERYYSLLYMNYVVPIGVILIGKGGYNIFINHND